MLRLLIDAAFFFQTYNNEIVQLRVKYHRDWPHAKIYKRVNCPYPPGAVQLWDELIAECATQEIDIGLDAERPSKIPDKQWMIAFLGTLNPEHRFFKKDFRPAPRQN